VIRLAIIGLGAVTRHIHLPAYRQLKGQVQVVGGADPDPEARRRAQAAGVPAVFEDSESMLATVRADLVAVCTPPDRHRADTELALAAGAHVFLEKPLAPTLAEADAIIAAAVGANRRVVVNNQFPWMRIHAAARRQIDTPAFGRLLHLHAAHTMQPTAQSEAGWRGGLERRLGFEFGIHVVDLVRFFFEATPVRLFAHLPRPVPAQVGDAINTVALEFADGRGASIVLDRLSRGPERYLDLRLDGEHAAIHTAIGGSLELTAGLHTRERRPFLDWRYAGGGRAVIQQGTRSRLLATDPVNPFATATAAHLKEVLNDLATGARSRADAAANRRSLAMVLAVYRSAETGQVVTLGTGAEL
jgi:predicted dehydrogenase